MTVTTQDKTSTEALASDRRRPGRMNEVSPTLIPILRKGEAPSGLDAQIQFDEPDEIAGARGVVFGVALSAPLWVGIVYLGRWLFA